MSTLQDNRPSFERVSQQYVTSIILSHRYQLNIRIVTTVPGEIFFLNRIALGFPVCIFKNLQDKIEL
jgi:hypothetical protein